MLKSLLAEAALHAQQSFRQQELAIRSAEASARALNRALQLSERLSASTPIATLFHSDPEAFDLFRWFLELPGIDAQRVRLEPTPSVLSSSDELTNLFAQLSIWATPAPERSPLTVHPALSTAPTPSVPVATVATGASSTRAPTRTCRASASIRPQRALPRRSVLIDDEAIESSGEGDGDEEEDEEEDQGESVGGSEDQDEEEAAGSGAGDRSASPQRQGLLRLKRAGSSPAPRPRVKRARR